MRATKQLGLVRKPVPVSPEDFESGEMARLVARVSSSIGFRHLGGAQVLALVAAGFGYKSWEQMRSCKEPAAAHAELPARIYGVMDIIGWRMFRTGLVGLREGVTAMHAALDNSKLTIRQKYSDFGERTGRDDRHESGEVVPGVWLGWSPAEMMESGRVRMQWAGEMAWGAACLCWDETCGLTMDEVVKEIERGSELTVEELIEDSWMYSNAWPRGLRPLQYQTADGVLLGYGWCWDEIGMRTAQIFGTKEALKESAVRLWRMEKIGDLGLAELPPTVLEVEFVNPWGLKDRHRAKSRALKTAIEYETKNKDRTPWIEVFNTDGKTLQLGRTADIAGDAWTGVSRARPNIPELLAQRIPSMDEVRSAAQEVTWVRAKIPYALETSDYETMCRVWMAEDSLLQAAADRIRAQGGEAWLSDLMKRSCEGARAGVSRRSAALFEDPSGHIKRFEVPMAGQDLLEVYPELKSLRGFVRGEYALGFFGKDGIRHKQAHLQRNAGFMVYAILRNLGIDVQVDYRNNHLKLLELAREGMVSLDWGNTEARDLLASRVMAAYRVFDWAEGVRTDIEGEWDGYSRLVELGLIEKEEEESPL